MQPSDEEATPEDLQAVHELGYTYVVLQLDAFAAEYQEAGLIDNGMRARQRRVYRELDKLLGRPVYRDARMAIYSPWGAPSPCEDAPAEAIPEADTEAIGIRQSEVGNVLMRPPEALVLSRVFEGDVDALGDPRSDDDADEEDDGEKDDGEEGTDKSDRFKVDTGDDG